MNVLGGNLATFSQLIRTLSSNLDDAPRLRILVIKCASVADAVPRVLSVQQRFTVARAPRERVTSLDLFSYGNGRSTRFAETFGANHRDLILSPREEPVSNFTDHL